MGKLLNVNIYRDFIIRVLDLHILSFTLICSGKIYAADRFLGVGKNRGKRLSLHCWRFEEIDVVVSEKIYECGQNNLLVLVIFKWAESIYILISNWGKILAKFCVWAFLAEISTVKLSWRCNHHVPLGQETILLIFIFLSNVWYLI